MESRGCGRELLGHDQVQVDCAGRSALGRGEVEAFVVFRGMRELLDDVQFPVQEVGAPGAILHAENLADPHALAGAEPDRGAVAIRHDVDELVELLQVRRQP